ncbi:hypothetical protein [Enhygromyxa salina]|uniref:DegT/DnrJ/EryC1/StrS aminotransferase family protein n=1 Tax=Enhygromyxa salina TaxID=215803 RepID=A0A2S9YFD2_9BACT|nr:hypothetical protein [Enhygromyxa salina]PRQ03814.1 hypothetical protein ENSA7_52810 [Enhygromyxa salina]
MIDARWEFGSEFHWQPGAVVADDPERAWLLDRAGCAYASGRGALAALVEQRGFARVWLPSYVCEELTAAAGASLRSYPDHPDHPGQPFDPAKLLELAKPGDAVVRINYFGLRGPSPAVDLRAAGLVVIDDHTHDPCGPWAVACDADYAFASLRKSLPLPDGALLWSPVGAPLPAAPAPCEPAAAKLSAMLLKRLYLDGHAVDKATFRELALAGERTLGALGGVGISPTSRALLGALEVKRLREDRRNNFVHFIRTLDGAVEVLEPDPRSRGGLAPFACVLRLDTRARRDALRAGLIARNIYPALLWDLDPFVGHRARFAASCALADRLLALHCDARYGRADLERVARAVRELVSS